MQFRVQNNVGSFVNLLLLTNTKLDLKVPRPVTSPGPGQQGGMDVQLALMIHSRSGCWLLAESLTSLQTS